MRETLCLAAVALSICKWLQSYVEVKVVQVKQIQGVRATSTDCHIAESGAGRRRYVARASQIAQTGVSAPHSFLED
jgi:hypothetical protein